MAEFDKIGDYVAESFGNVDFGKFEFGSDPTAKRRVRLTSSGDSLVKKDATVEELVRSTGGREFYVWAETEEGEYRIRYK